MNKCSDSDVLIPVKQETKKFLLKITEFLSINSCKVVSLKENGLIFVDSGGYL